MFAYDYDFNFLGKIGKKEKLTHQTILFLYAIYTFASLGENKI